MRVHVYAVIDQRVVQKARLAPTEGILAVGADVFLAPALGAGSRDAGLGSADEGGLLDGIPLAAGAFKPEVPAILATTPAPVVRPMLVGRAAAGALLVAVFCALAATVAAALKVCNGGCAR